MDNADMAAIKAGVGLGVLSVAILWCGGGPMMLAPIIAPALLGLYSECRSQDGDTSD